MKSLLSTVDDPAFHPEAFQKGRGETAAQEVWAHPKVPSLQQTEEPLRGYPHSTRVRYLHHMESYIVIWNLISSPQMNQTGTGVWRHAYNIIHPLYCKSRKFRKSTNEWLDSSLILITICFMCVMAVWQSSHLFLSNVVKVFFPSLIIFFPLKYFEWYRSCH